MKFVKLWQKMASAIVSLQTTLMWSPVVGHDYTCGDAQYQIKHLSHRIDPYELPLKLKFDNLVWPIWTPIDPSLHFDLIKMDERHGL